MDQSSNKEGEDHDEGHHQHMNFSYHQQQEPGLTGRGTCHFTSSSSSRDNGCSTSPSDHPQTRDWFATTHRPASAEDNSKACFRSSYNFMEENEEDESDIVRMRLEQQLQPSSSSSSYLNSHSSHHHQYSQTLAPIEHIEREHMFDKVVTPSDVGKLNRLVIPKQHAERHFPLDSSSNDKGLLLNFEDRTRKMWRFRYSYWNSSQSYVMTKGWSRFVKDKKLDAGDIVSFQRGVGEAFRDRLFIDWRRKPSNPLMFHVHEPSFIIPSMSQLPYQYFPFHQGINRSPTPWTGSGGYSTTPLYLRPLAQLTSGHHFPQHNFNNNFMNSRPHHYINQQQQGGGVRVLNNFQCSPLYNNNTNNGVIISHHHPYGAAEVVGSSSSDQTVVYLKSNADDQSPGSGDHGMNSTVFDSVNAVHPPKADQGKKLRLFGVNMECDNFQNIVDESDQKISSSSTSSIPAIVITSPIDSPQNHNEGSQGMTKSLNLRF